MKEKKVSSRRTEGIKASEGIERKVLERERKRDITKVTFTEGTLRDTACEKHQV